MYANKSLARKFVFVFIRGRGIWDSKNQWGFCYRGWDKYIKYINFFNFLEKIFCWELSFQQIIKKECICCTPQTSLLVNSQKVPSSLINTPSSKTLSGFKFFEPGAKVQKKRIPIKFLYNYFAISYYLIFLCKIFHIFLCSLKNSVYLCKIK